MAEYGIWTIDGGGFTERDLHSPEDTEARLAEIIRDSEDPQTDREDLRVEELCPEHADDEQPKNGCETCATEER
jgi:hypothetical protein